MKLRFYVVLAVVLLVGVSAFAQTTGTLTGTATLGGNPLPGVTVTVSSPNLIGTRTTVTDANGNYTIGAIPPGEYTIKFEMESMQTVTRTTRVGLATTARVDAELKLTAVAEAITVTASAPAVLETTEVQTNITSQLVSNLPMARDLRGTVGLAPGVTSTGPGNAQTISGAPSFDSLYMIDGAVVNENLRGQPHDLFIEDAIQETTVLTGGISAEFGRFTGGVVTAVSKTGGNEFSGSFRDSFQSPKWTALSPNSTARRTKNINQTYEATLGGRIIRDRLWFFTAGRYFQTNSASPLFGVGAPTVPTSREQQRIEIKLTGQITPKHSLTVSSLDIKDDQVNNFFPSAARTWEVRSVDPGRSLPNSFLTAHYNGVITNSFLVEGLYSKKKFAFEQSGGDSRDLVLGTNANDINGTFFGAPTFCGVCTPENRDNKNWQAKGTYYLSTKGTGTHNLVAGYDDWVSMRKSDNHQSGSDFTIGMYSSPSAAFPTGGIQRQSDGSIRVSTRAGFETFIIWWPILEASKGTRLKTRSFFVNDKWDFSNKLSFNLGGRYDQNIGRDGARQLVADDSKISPRLGVIFDTFGNGRLRLNASYSQYVAAIADGNVADSTSPAGSPSYLYWAYYGPDIIQATSTEFFQKIFDWFKSVGFTSNTDFLVGGGTNGIKATIPEPLESPYVGEWTLGLGTQIGTRGFFRADYINREWKNFYTTQTSLANGKVSDPLAGGALLDKTFIGTTNDFKRTYRAIQLQAAYSPWTRVNLGGNYTNSRLRGNHGAETAGSGPITNSGVADYSEYLGYPNRNPIGWLSADQRHKVRAWVSYDQPTPIGTFNFSVLQRYDSGVPYSAIGTINPTRFFCTQSHVDGGRCTAAQLNTTRTKPNPGYAAPPTQANYYFSKRGEFRTDDITASDLAVNWSLPPLFGKAQFYVETELRNVFNESGVTNVNTTVTILRQFDPFRDTPVEGVNWVKGANFGKPLTATTGNTQGDWQLPRTFLISAGVRF